MACYIYQLPAWVLDDLCRNMDTLSDWDWMQFASKVIPDLTQLRKIKSMERVQGVSITRELLWWWGMRQATVQQLVDLLCRLELYRAAQIVLSWKPVPETRPSFPASPEVVKPGPVAASGRNTQDEQERGQPLRPTAFPGPGSAPARDQQQHSLLLSSKGVVLHSSRPHLPTSLDSKDFSTSVPQQEKCSNMTEESLFWSEAEVIQATGDFDQSHRISEGTFADVYRGQRHGMPLAFKKLRETACSSPGSVERYFQAEVQLCLRCCHPNILPLLGYCSGKQFHSLIYPYMTNGSLQDRLQSQGDLEPLPWPQRVSICSGLLCAVEHLHGLEIIHGNIKRIWDADILTCISHAELGSNVLLDQNFTPKLAHPMAHLCPVNQRSKYTMMKTHLFQASAAYLPEDFIRVGQLTKRVDIFSCGIVLAEILTGIPAVDNDRSPVYLKDLLLSEIPSSTSSLSSRKTGVEKAVAKEICQKYLEKRAGALPEHCAEALGTAICLCLRRRNASLEEARGSVALVEEWFRSQETSLPWSGFSEGTGASSNTPEETDDVDDGSLDAPSSVRTSPVPAENGEGRLQDTRGVEADSSEACTGPRAPEDATETSWEVEINEAKRKLMENILLYNEEQLDSAELFGP
nr:interleukin-1 receptor-associated kinase-like 2 isoform X1 [Marmota flaviventris]